jgi:hypothetical protein
MTDAISVKCSRSVGEAEVCGVACRRWRACPVSDCGETIARCDGHGGDARAMSLMVDHVAGHITNGSLTLLITG